MVISPLAQRQIFQAANLEAMRAATEVGDQLQRETMRKKVAEDHAAEDQASVRVIPQAERLRTEERKGRPRDRGREGARDDEPEAEGRGLASSEGESAGPAETHVDFLA